MLFSSITFLSIFLPAVLVSYYLIPTIKAKNCFLLIASFVFYAWGEGYWTLVLIVSILINYVFGFYVAQALGRPQAKFLVGLCVVANVLLLGYFKYFNFAMRQANNVPGPGRHVADRLCACASSARHLLLHLSWPDL